MINNIEDLKEFIRADMKANKIKKYRYFFLNEILKFLFYLRFLEYLINTKSNRFVVWIIRRKWYKQSVKTGLSIPPNTFDMGLYIPHYGCIVVNPKAHFGKNCIVQCGVNISENVTGGGDLYLGAGAKLMPGVMLGNGIIVGANTVVTRNFLDDNIVIAGCPAKKINNNGMYSNRDII